jgi:Cytochrome c3
MELVLQDNCILCHSDPGNVKPRVLFSPDPAKQGSNPLLNLKEFVSDTHFRRGLSCSGCHGGSPKDDSMSPEIGQRWPHQDERQKDRAWIPDFCARCHADPSFMRGFNPVMPTDQLAKYRESRHGILLLQQHDSNAAQCVSCHGVHGIQKPTDALVGDKPGNLCHECHAVYSRDNPRCDSTAAAFRASLDELSAGRAEIAPQEDALAEKGLDAEPLSRAVGELDEALVQTRTRVHSFDLGTFQQAAGTAKEALQKGRASVASARADYRFRQRGLLLALASIGLLALGIALKLRDGDRRRGGK